MSILLIFALIFIALFVLIGGERGVISLITLVANGIIFLLCTVTISAGVPALLVAILGGTLIGGVTIFYQNGNNVKSKAAMISAVAVIIGLVIPVVFIGLSMNLGGLDEIELKSDMALYYNFGINISFHTLMIAVILIGLLGAILDTAVAVSSGLYEVYLANKELTLKQLRKSGRAIGKDILATTFNTLYFAYVGEALMMLVYLGKYKYTFVQVINSKVFLQGFVSIVFSAVGCTLVIPITAYVSAYMYKTDFR